MFTPCQYIHRLMVFLDVSQTLLFFLDVLLYTYHLLFQPPFPVVDSATASLLKSFPNIKCVSDPSTISVCGVNIGITSSDILFHLGKEEISFPPRSGDRMARLASHLLTQVRTISHVWTAYVQWLLLPGVFLSTLSAFRGDERRL